MKCQACDGRGWVKAPPGTATWAEACPLCELSSLGTCALARHLEVNRRDVYRVRTMQAGRKVSMRVLGAIYVNARAAR
jgi:hypothetical protein